MSLLVKGVTDFLGLLDTPAAYAGKTTQLPRVKATEDGLEFAPGGKFTATKVFDGATASPPTICVSPLTMIPYTYLDGLTRGIAGYGAIVIGDYLYVAGGSTTPYGNVYTNLCYRFHLDSEVWEKLTSAPTAFTTTMRGSPVGYYNGKIYILTKLTTGGADYTRVLSYDISADSWSVEATLPALGAAPTSLLCFACTDFLYVYQSKYTTPGVGPHRFDKMDYTTKAWTGLTALTVVPGDMVGGVIGDEIYLTDAYDKKTYLYNKAGDSWGDTGQDWPGTSLVNGGGMNYIEDQDCFWSRTGVVTPNTPYYRYTPAGGWVLQFTEGRSTYSWDFLLERSSNGQIYVLWGSGWQSSQPESPWAGAVLTCHPDGVWHLLTQTFNAGDLMILYEQAGIPTKVERNSKPLFTGSGMDTVYIVETGSYYFSLSKDFDLKSVQIWRSVWG